MRRFDYYFLVSIFVLLNGCHSNTHYELMIDGEPFGIASTCWDCESDDDGKTLSKIEVSSNVPLESLVFSGTMVKSQEVVDNKKIVFFETQPREIITISCPDCDTLFITIPQDLRTGSMFYMRIVRVETIAYPSSFDSSINSLTESVNGVAFEMVKVDGGSFQMGATPEVNFDNSVLENGMQVMDYSRPIHKVYVNDFYIGKYEVTQKLWKAVMGNNPSEFKGDDLPVENVSWMDANVFISLLNKKTGKNYRLPTEAEWEFAARGGNQSKKYAYSGGNNPDTVAWHLFNSDNKTHPVGQLLPNELNLYDMSGNVWEWCYDWFAPYTENPQHNPHGPQNGDFRIFRGGSWFYVSLDSKTANRNGSRPNEAFNYVGFRLAL